MVGQKLAEVVDVFKCCIFTWGALTTILPAFIIAGAVIAFVPAQALARYLGAEAKRYVSYPVAVAAGALLEACSCNVIPLFASILRRGAGIGPAFTFLYAGPALNIVSTIFTFKVIGPIVGIWRMVGVLVISLILGPIMEFVSRKERPAPPPKTAGLAVEKVKKARLVALFTLLLAALVIGSLLGSPTSADIIDKTGTRLKFLSLFVSLALLLWLIMAKFKRVELLDWLKQTYGLLKLIVPLFIISILIIGLIARFIDIRWINTMLAAKKDPLGYRLFMPTFSTTFFAGIFGALMYFPILSEVVFTKAFLKLGMDIGPALAILLSGAGTSLPGFLIISRIVGWRKVAVYFFVSAGLTITFATALAMRMGDYICACLVIK